jgi:uncharacterized protein YbjT (DUF2867 family)
MAQLMRHIQSQTIARFAIQEIRMKVYVFGATGTVGAPLVETLLAGGHEVLAATRKPGPDKNGVHYVDAQKPEEIAKADAVFLLSPGGVPDQYSMLKPYLDAASSAKTGKVVLMTAMGVEHAPDEAPMRKLELELLGSGLNATVVRPNWFMQNFNSYWIQGILTDQKIYFPGGDAVVSFIDARDIGAVAANIVTGTNYGGQGLALTGSEALNHDQVAAKIASATGKKIEYVNVDPEDFKGMLRQGGLPEDYVELLSGIAAALREGHAAPVSDAVEKVLGKAPISFDQYALDYAGAWEGG